MKNTQISVCAESFHVYECHNPMSHISMEPIDELDYQHDPWYDIGYSIIEPSDLSVISEQLKQGIPMNYEHLLHFCESHSHIVRKILNRNNFVHDWECVSSLLVSVARIQRFQFDNIELGDLLFEHAVNCGIGKDEIYYHMVDQQGDESDFYGNDDFDLEEFVYSLKSTSENTLPKPRPIG